MGTSTVSDLVRKYFSAYESKDRKVVEDLLSDELELKTGAKFRNTEYFRFEGNKVKEVEVYFGSLPEDNREESQS